MRREDKEGISAGRFVNPHSLPPVRTARLQAWWDKPSLPDASYMNGDAETPAGTQSTDDKGSTEAWDSPIATRRGNRIEVDYPVFTGGTYLHPELLPPVREYHIQAGRYVNSGVVSPPEQYVPEAYRLV